MAGKERSKLEVRAERAVLAAVRLPDSKFDASDPFGELRALAEQAGAVVVGECTQNLDRPVAGTYMGSGKVQELKALCEMLDAGTIIFDHDLSPKQLGNIERETGRKVVDRSELILDIFASRATTHEAKLQVELAQLEYTYPRLRAMWDHLERIVGRGGIGGIGTRGPGEQQLEIDRRLVQQRRLALERQLEEIQARRRREVAARKAEHITVGIVGYTNAGKSTLFNTLTAGGAYADNRLFATLMTRTREWRIAQGPGGADGARVMLSDTVGFVRDLPHNLIASFKATLEEATHADLLLIVLDVSDPAAEMQYEAVTTTLDELFDEIESSTREEDRAVSRPPRLVCLNKADRLTDNARLLVWQRKVPGAIPICALPGPGGGPNLGHESLAARVREFALGEVGEYVLEVPMRNGRAAHFIETHGRVLDREYDDDRARFRVRLGARHVETLLASGAGARVVESPKAAAARARPTRPLPAKGLAPREAWTDQVAMAKAKAKPPARKTVTRRTGEAADPGKATGGAASARPDADSGAGSSGAPKRRRPRASKRTA